MLKRNLAELIDEARAGERILVTRHDRPVATISAADADALHVGAAFGKAALGPLLRRASRGRYLEVLAEGRGEQGR